jgi:prepilin-type N-terminal cleavage/methylation domain-containing protein
MRLTATVSGRRGSTLPELLVALTIWGVLATAFLRTVHQSLRFLNDHTVLVEQRAQLEAASHVTAALLSDASPIDGDLVALSDTAAVFRATIGTTVACRTAGPSVEIPPLSLASGIPLSAFTDQPKVGDLVARFDEGSLASAIDDHWAFHSVVAIHALTGACTTTPFADPLADATRTGWTLDLVPAPPPTPSAIPLRLLRPLRLALYHSAPAWMLGYTEWNAASAAWNLIQPVAGALTSGAGPAPGIHWAWHDTLGAVAPMPNQVAVLGAMFRAPTRSPLRLRGRRSGVRLDSLGMTLVFRNRR